MIVDMILDGSRRWYWRCSCVTSKLVDRPPRNVCQEALASMRLGVNLGDKQLRRVSVNQMMPQFIYCRMESSKSGVSSEALRAEYRWSRAPKVVHLAKLTQCRL
jgi:hypothetical protein